MLVRELSNVNTFEVGFRKLGFCGYLNLKGFSC